MRDRGARRPGRGSMVWTAAKISIGDPRAGIAASGAINPAPFWRSPLRRRDDCFFLTRTGPASLENALVARAKLSGFYFLMNCGNHWLASLRVAD